MPTVLDSSDYITFPFSKELLLDKIGSNPDNLMDVDVFHNISVCFFTHSLIHIYVTNLAQVSLDFPCFSRGVTCIILVSMNILHWGFDSN